VAAGVNGAFTATGATDLIRVTVVNAIFGSNLVSTANATGATVDLDNAVMGGNITCQVLVANRSALGAGTHTVKAGIASATYMQCTFTGAVAIVAGATGVILMDGPSWRSFQEAGGAITSGIVLIVGGSKAGIVQSPPTAAAGASTSIGDAAASVSLNGTGASAGFTGGGNLYEEKTTLTAGRIVTVKTGGGEATGDTIDIVRSGPSGALGAFTLTINNNAGNPQAVIAASQRGWVRVQFNTTIANDWGVIAVGGGVT